MHKHVITARFVFLLLQMYSPDTGQHLHTLSPDVIGSGEQLPVTSIRFKPSSVGDKIEHTHILIATCECGVASKQQYMVKQKKQKFVPNKRIHPKITIDNWSKLLSLSSFEVKFAIKL